MRNRSWLKWALIAGGVELVLVVVAPFVYFNFIKEDAPEKLSASDVTVQDGTNVSIDGTYSAGDGSQAGYRAKEVLFGQDATAAGRTDQIDGTVTVAGTTVSDASITVDMASVKSDQ